jgi:hypothetical protein
VAIIGEGLGKEKQAVCVMGFLWLPSIIEHLV